MTHYLTVFFLIFPQVLMVRPGETQRVLNIDMIMMLQTWPCIKENP